MPRPTAAAIKKVRGSYLQLPVGCLLVLAAIHIIDKDPGDKDFRFILTLVYFTAVFVLLYALTKPRSNYMRQFYAWKYEDSGPAMEQTWKLYLRSLDRLMNVIAVVVGAFVACCALRVLSKWPALSDLDALSGLYGIGWWICLAALVLLPVAGGGLFSETFQRHRALEESVDISSFKPRDLADLEKAEKEETSEAPPVQPIGDHRFEAGGFAWTWEDFFKNCIVFGMTGTGKTVCLLNALLDGLMASSTAKPAAGLILDPKGDFLRKIRGLCRSYGRENDLLVLNPSDLSNTIRWNPFDSDDDELELSARFAAVLQAVGQKGGGGEDAFWIDSARKFIRYAIVLLRLTNSPGEPPTFAQINELATSLAAISERCDLIDINDGRGDQALAYFCNEWFKIPENTRNTILAFLTNMVDPFLMYPYSEVFSGPSTIRVADIIDSGKVLYVYMPIADKEAMSRVICTFVKLEYFREVLKRPDKPRCSFFVCDEFQQFFTVMEGKGDADFFERSRQSRHANIIATQNYPALLKKAGDKESIVKNLLGNCATKIFLRNTDDQTNKYASELFGKELVRMLNPSIGASQGRFAVGGSAQTSASAQYDDKVRNEEFIRLAVPSREDGIDYAETIIHLAARGEVQHKKLKWKVHPL